jgi:hypothetical protein
LLLVLPLIQGRCYNMGKVRGNQTMAASLPDTSLDQLDLVPNVVLKSWLNG